MVRFGIALLFTLFTCLGWGLATPLIIKVNAASAKPHFLQPFFLNAVGHVIYAVLVLVATRFAILGSFSGMHASGWALLLIWPAAGFVFTLALFIAPEKGSVLNALAATYPILVSLPVLVLFMGEALSPAKIIGTALTVSGVLIVLLAK